MGQNHIWTNGHRELGSFVAAQLWPMRSVTGNVRITYRFEGQHAIAVNLEDDP